MNAFVLIAQITDTHITVNGRQAQDLQAALTWLGTLDRRPDLVLLSGDLVHAGRIDQYVRLRPILAASPVPVYLVPGNHDRRDALRAALPAAYYPGVASERLNYVLDTTPVRIVAVDTTEFGQPGGTLDPASLAWLDRTLDAAPDRPTLLFMHHPPIRTGVRLADMLGFRGLRAFKQIVARRAQVRRIVSGHVHSVRSGTVAHALATSTLSSTPQLVPEFFERRIAGLRPEPAGFALLHWDGSAFTTTTYVAAAAGGFTSCNGSGATSSPHACQP